MKNTLALVLMVIGIVGCAKNPDTMLVCDCYSERELTKDGVITRECSEVLFGNSRVALVFNQKNNTINWRGYKNVGYEEVYGMVRETELSFDDDIIYFNSILTSKTDFGNGVKEVKDNWNLTFNRLSLVAEDYNFGDLVNPTTRISYCKLTEEI